MAYLQALVTVSLVFLVPPFIFVLAIVLLTASVGKSIGIREIYVKKLIQIFEVSSRGTYKDYFQ